MPEPLTIVMVGAGGTGLLLQLAKRQFHLFKEVLDLVGGSILLVLTSAIVIPCALIVKLADPSGPMFFSQVRVGLNGKLIKIYKLRTMWMDAEAHGHAIRAGKGDPRVIPACRWMRKSHVDELPQLVNIVKGDMSLVGPRPERPELFKELSAELPDFEQRLAVKPGLTGLAQIRNGYDTDMASVRRKLDYDLEYISRMSLGLELKLLLATFTKLNDKGAH